MVQPDLSIDVTPLASGDHATSRPDMSVADKSVDARVHLSVEFDDRTREIKDTSMSVDETIRPVTKGGQGGRAPR